MQKNGFNLIELMIVVAIIAIMAAIMIPNLIASKIEANEKDVISFLEKISEWQKVWIEKKGQPASLEELLRSDNLDPDRLRPLGATNLESSFDGKNGVYVNWGYCFYIHSWERAHPHPNGWRVYAWPTSSVGRSFAWDDLDKGLRELVKPDITWKLPLVVRVDIETK
jgi:prepilin-type N-terminal cleavage/methylation domain-containing protein